MKTKCRKLGDAAETLGSPPPAAPEAAPAASSANHSRSHGCVKFCQVLAGALYGISQEFPKAL